MNTDQPVLLLVGAVGPDPSAADVAVTTLNQARARGFRTHLIDTSVGLATDVTTAADQLSLVDVESPGDAVAWARAQRRRGARVDAVLGVRESVDVTVAELATELGVPGNAPHAVRAVRDKAACRGLLRDAGHLQPAFRVCADAAEAAAFLAESSGPWVVKPVTGGGGMGVSKVRGPIDLPSAVAALPVPGPFLVEEFVTGREFSAEGLFVGGVAHVLALTVKEKLPSPYFVELGHVAPAELPADTQREIEHEVVAALATLELTYGFFHVELWLNPGGVVVGEVHVRIGDSWTHLMLGHALPGVDLFGVACADAIGKRPTGQKPAPVRAAAVRFFDPSPGRLVAVHGWQRVLDDPAVLHAELTVAPGDTIVSIEDATDRVGAVVVGGRTPAAARALAWELAASVRFEVTTGDRDADEFAVVPELPALGKPAWQLEPRDIVRR